MTGSDNPAYAKNITKSSARRKEKQSVDNPNPIKQEDVFDVDAKEFTIAPHSHRKVQLTFKPASIEDYKGTVDITLPARPGMERFSFTVLGQVTVPQISILEPRLGDDLNLTLSMNPTLVGRRAMKSLKFQNTSKVRAQVILELLKNESDVFKVIPLKETVPLLLMET
ncbi:hydrocephalus-inducing protein homolog, partial [Diaphorina citri]|uniref:Hydrocephalus-inducing protein homolog n=1 Tax=Diaphorina citri TaxID=121845 RepID=A0A1S3DM41_DIACI